MRVLSPLALASILVLSAVVPAGAAPTATVVEASVLHDGPGARFARLGVVERNAQATVKGCNRSGRWCEIDAGGKQGWVMASHLSPSEAAKEPAEKERTPPVAEPKTSAPPPVVVETEKGAKGDRMSVTGSPVTILIKSADGKVSSTMTVAAGSKVVVTASGRSRCELKAAVNP